MMRCSLRSVFICIALIAAVSCGDSNKDNSSGSPTSPTPTLNLAGTWSGTVREVGSTETLLQATWTATQSGSAVTGPFVLSRTGQTIQLNGTLAGTLSGTQLALTLTMPAGAFTPIGGPSTCSATGTGTSEATTATSVSSTLTLSYAASCVGTFTPTATSMQLTLAK